MAFLGHIFVQELVKIALKEVVEVAVVATAVTTTSYLGYKTVEAVSDMAARESSSSSSTNSGFYLGRRTIYDWWGNGLDLEERQSLLSWGYNDRSDCFSLEELKGMLRLEQKAPGKPTGNDGFEPKSGWDGKTLERAPKSHHKKGYPDNKGRVWVPTGKNTDNVKQHGDPHWDRVYPDGSHDNVYPRGKVRSGSN
ncbi:MAG: hypothetical protein NY202_00605 [Mollicutes bacterium UO1]